ncbi:hypothetical protein GCM10010123_15760 [Pilimelia anulata]|uniref:Uncharacterized protein n=1 Tax=Pilimelia anulata TaxID=53371 RepID=A0A8J3B659_9ACTN|nr:hypothetical protein [Pilimelia anulata]GGJ87013.1 hypothetical protein GCM10010123_15760 [Pilimelia anulata]
MIVTLEPPRLNPLSYARPPHPAQEGPTMVVRILGDPLPLRGVAELLPPGWRLRLATDLRFLRKGEIVVASRAPAGLVGRIRAELPAEHRLVAVVGRRATGEDIADALTAGADACVRTGSPQLLAAQLVACHRRRVMTLVPSPAGAGGPAARGGRPGVRR